MDATGCQICWQAVTTNTTSSELRLGRCRAVILSALDGHANMQHVCVRRLKGLCLLQLPGLDASNECPACRQCLAATNPQSFSFNYALEAMMDWLRDCHIAKTTISDLDPSSLRTQFSVGLADGCCQKTFVSMNTVLQVPCRSFKSRCNSQTGLLVRQEWPHQVRELLA